MFEERILRGVRPVPHLFSLVSVNGGDGVTELIELMAGGEIRKRRVGLEPREERPQPRVRIRR